MYTQVSVVLLFLMCKLITVRTYSQEDQKMSKDKKLLRSMTSFVSGQDSLSRMLKEAHEGGVHYGKY